MSEFPEDEFSPEELAEAQALARKVDDLVAGKAAPVLIDTDTRESLQLASQIHAAHHEALLPEARKTALIEQAMASASGAGRANFEDASSDIARARGKRRLAPSLGVLGIVVAAAAILLVWRARPEDMAGKQGAVAEQAAHFDIPAREQSRASDALIGPIAQNESGLAARRLQSLRQDRMAGYRSLRYRQMGVPQ